MLVWVDFLLFATFLGGKGGYALTTGIMDLALRFDVCDIRCGEELVGKEVRSDPISNLQQSVIESQTNICARK